MSAKTTFWYGLVVALAVVGSAIALPLSTNDEPALESGAKTVVLPEQPKEPTGQTEDLATVSTDPSTVPQTVKTESNDDGATSTAAAAPTSTADAAVTSTAADAATSTAADAATSTAADATSGVHQTETATGSTLPAESETGSDRSDTGTTTTATVGSGQQEPVAGVQSQRPKPYYAGDAQTVKVGPSIPFYLEFFQPFQPIDPNRQNNMPPRHQPYGAIIDPFDPFENNPMASPFNRIIEAYTNEFRKMLESFDQNMQRIPQQVENFDNTQSGSNKPVSKTTTKTEIINGHVVQINETTYTNGDENHKSFYHFKEIQVLPDANSKKIANEKLMSITKDDSEKVELNEIKRDPIETFGNVPEAIIQPNIEKKNVVASGPLDEYYQTAAASNYGSPYAPAYYVPKSSYNPMPSPPPVYWNGLFDHQRPHGHHFGGYQFGHPLGGNQHGGHHHQPGVQPHAAVPGSHFGGGAPPVISLSSDTLVNDLMAERIKASGSQYQLPADVVLVDVNELQQRRPSPARGVRRSPPLQSAHDGRPHVVLL